MRYVHDGLPTTCMTHHVHAPHNHSTKVGTVHPHLFHTLSMCNCYQSVSAATSPHPQTTPHTPRHPPPPPHPPHTQGTLNIISVAQRMGIKKVVLVSSIGVDELLSPFNLFGGLAFWKKQAELALQRSGLDYTIVRPGVCVW